MRHDDWDEAVPVLHSYPRQLKLAVRPYSNVTPSSPDVAFMAEAPRHPVFLLTGTATSSPGRA